MQHAAMQVRGIPSVQLYVQKRSFSGRILTYNICLDVTIVVGSKTEI